MSSEQYQHERLEWALRHGGSSNAIVPVCVVLAVFLALVVLF